VLRDIVRFEWRYHTRQISFVAAALLFFGFGFMVTATGFGPDNVNINSPYSIAQSIGMLSLLSVFVLAVFCANAVVRDRETRMEEIVFTTSVEKLPFLLGRFTGSFLAAFTAFSTSALGMLAARYMPWHEADRLGDTNLLHYVWALLVIALPNMLFAAVTLFAISTITRSVLASYAGSVLVYVLYFASAAMTNSPLMAASVPGTNESAWVAALLDPFALSAFFEQTQHWVPGVRNTRVVALSGNFLLNRLVWVGASVGLLAVVYRLFSFRVSGARPPRPSGAPVFDRPVRRPSAGSPGGSFEATLPTEGRRTGRSKTGAPSPWQAYLSATRLEIRSFFLTRYFLAITLLWAGLAAFELISDVNSGEYGSASYPAAGILFATINTPLSLLTTILLIYTSAEMVWRERTLRVSEILHATPASNAVFVLSKSTALTVLVGALTGTALLAAALLQLAKGWTPDFGAMLSFAWFAMVPLVLFAVAAIVIQTLSPHKYFGMLLVLLLAVVTHQGQGLGLAHPLWRFASSPGLGYSELTGFGRTGGFHWLMLYWAALAGFFLMLAIALWRHGAGGLRHLRPILRRTPGWGRTLAIALAAVFVSSGAFIFYNTNILNAHESAADVLAWKAEYEKTYKAFAAIPQPRVTAIRMDFDLFPEERRYRLHGEYTVVNVSAKPVEKILVAVRNEATVHSVAIPAAKLLSRDPRFGQFVFALDKPLPPSGQTTVRMDVSFASPGFESGAPDYTISENGSFIMNHRSFPTIGYRPGYEIEDARERRRQGLPVSAASAERKEWLDHEEIESIEWASFDIRVSTSDDQTVVAPGTLVGTSEQNGRRTFHFRSDAPMPNIFTVASARYAAKKETQDGVSIEVYHHPSHTQNVDRILRASKDALRYCTAAFGPYSERHLRIAEVSAHFQGFSGMARPGVVFLGENRGFLIDARDPRRLDLVYRRVAHEVAHQWWGYQLIAADAPGATTLVETLTKYAELMILEKAYGRETVRESLTYELDLYLRGRTGDTGAEPPLARAGRQSYLYYRKGAIVMYALKDLIGEEPVNQALRNLIRDHGGPEGRPTTAHLLQQIRAVAPPEHHALIDEWFQDVVLYDMKMESATSRRLPGGRYEVKMRIRAAKHREDTPLPLRESLDVGVFSAEGPLAVARHAFRDGINDIIVIVDKEPLSAAVDPYVTRIDTNRFDNEARIEER